MNIINKYALRIIIYSSLFLIAFAIIYVLEGLGDSLIFLLGGVIYIIPFLFSKLYLQNALKSNSQKDKISILYKGFAYKIIITIALFIITFRSLESYRDQLGFIFLGYALLLILEKAVSILSLTKK